MDERQVLVFTAQVDTYHRFRRSFNWNGAGDVHLRISGETTWVAYVNGQRLPMAQLADMPLDRTWSELDITAYLKQGLNWLAVEVHYVGENFLTCQKSAPFLWCEVNGTDGLLCQVDNHWEYQEDPAYHQGLACKVTGQLGFVFEANGGAMVPWQCGESADRWVRAAVGPLPGAVFSRRAIPQLTELPLPETHIVQMGYLLRRSPDGSFAKQCFEDYLTPRRAVDFFTAIPADLIDNNYQQRCIALKNIQGPSMELKPIPEGNDGAYLIIDTGRERVGFLTFRLTAPAGMVMDICHGEHLDDGRVRAHVGTRNFADRYICHEGVNEFTYYHRRLGCRYLELHLTNCGTGNIILEYVSLIPLELPLPPESSFSSPDRLLAHTNKVSADTLKLCMHEHYEDCPWREQALYAYDSRNQILYGYALWGNYEFVAACLDLLAKNNDGDRYFHLTSPGIIPLEIPVFTLVWFSEMREYWLHSGDIHLFNKWQKRIDTFLDNALAEPDPEFPGLYSSGTLEKYWNFCEWNGALSNMKGNGQGPYNIYLYEALRSTAVLYRASGNSQRAAYLDEKAASLGTAVERLLWRDDVQAYGYHASNQATDEVFAHIQAIMLANHLVPEAKLPAVIRCFGAKGVRPYDLSALQYVINGLMANGPEARAILLQELRGILDPIILSGATSIWETRQGAEDFAEAGSLCHGWSAAMPYFCRRAILGVYPTAPGFSEFAVSPYTAELPWAAGSIPTPHGPIEVKWVQTSAGLEVTLKHPEGTRPVLKALEECPVASMTVVP